MKEKLLERYEKWGFKQDLNILERQCIRVNTNLISPKKLLQRFSEKKVNVEKVEFLTNGYFVDSDFPISSMNEFLQGYFYIQESSAQIPVEIIKDYIKDKKFDELVVLDLCCAPGGKTTQLSEALKNKGKIVSVDSSRERLEKVCYNLERMKVVNVDLYCYDCLRLPFEKNYFDVVLLDVPCSGNYLQEKDWLDKRQFSDFKIKSEIQKQMIQEVAKFLKKGGLLIYSTCSLEKEENEEVVESILPILKLDKINISFGESGLTENTKLCKRIWPTQNKNPGFFIAKFIK